MAGLESFPRGPEASPENGQEQVKENQIQALMKLLQDEASELVKKYQGTYSETLNAYTDTETGATQGLADIAGEVNERFASQLDELGVPANTMPRFEVINSALGRLAKEGGSPEPPSSAA